MLYFLLQSISATCLARSSIEASSEPPLTIEVATLSSVDSSLATSRSTPESFVKKVGILKTMLMP